MENISQLIKEAKPLYFARKRRRRITAGMAAAVCAFMIGFMAMPRSETVLYDIWSEEVYYTQNGSEIENMGLPVDEYGLLMVG